MPSSRTSLSFVPKFRTAKSFSAGGVRSMTAPPTAVIGPASGRMTAATSSATASALNPAIRPLSAAKAARTQRDRRDPGAPSCASF